MIPALVSLKSLIKTKSYHIDYPLFRLHYQATVCALLAFCLILTAKILFGDTIDCKGRMLGRDDFYDNLCYSQGTFTMYAVDGHDFRAAAEQLGHLPFPKASNQHQQQSAESGLAPGLPVPQNLSAETKEKVQHHTGGASSTVTPKLEQPVERADEQSGVIPWVFGVVYNTLFDDEPDQTLPKTEKLVRGGEAESKLEVPHNKTNYHMLTYSAFPNNALHGTSAGEFLKHRFHTIHRIIKNNNLSFSSSIKYLYSGIVIPKENEEIYSVTYWHRYYQYIPIILFLQALFFYLPHYLWKIWENGIVSSICKQLHDNRFAPTEYIESNYHMIDYLQNCFTLNKSLVYKYYFCHILLLLNLICQIVVLNAIFNNQFVTYGIDFFHYLFIDNDMYGLRGIEGNINELNNPMDFVFPKVTACSVQTLSQAGKKPDMNQFLCVLPLNILHDKFFLILWFWFLILATLTILQIIFDALYTTTPMLRKYLFKRRFGPYLAEDNIHSLSLPELFLLNLIGSNSDKFAFSALLRKLNKDDWQVGLSENQSLV